MSQTTTAISRPALSTASPKADRGRVDAWITAAPDFAQPILNYLRETVHGAVPGADEEMKWSRPFFTVEGKLVCYMAAFKQHCGFGFWSPDMVTVLAQDGIVESGASGSFGRITTLADLPPKEDLARYLCHAAGLVRFGNAATPMAAKKRTSAKAPIAMPAEFANALKEAKQAGAMFEALPSSCRREYLEWISSAKRPETRQRRVQQTIARLNEGKRFNEQYRSS